MTSQSDSAKPANIWRRLRISRLGVIVALVAFLVLSGTGAFAYWSVTASMSTSAKAGTLAVTTSWSSSVGETFTNVGATITGAKTKTGEITITNTTSTASALAMSYSAALTYTGATPGPLATKLAVTVWEKSENCESEGDPSFSGTWALPPAISGTLVAGSSAVWCVRTAVAERSDLASTNDLVSLTPRFTATLTAGDNWIKTSPLAMGSPQKAEFIYPAMTPTAGVWYRLKTSLAADCGDIRGSGTVANGNNTDFIAYGCHGPPDVNQQFSFTATDTGYVTISVRLEPGTQLGVVGNAPGIGAVVNNQAANTSNQSQQWQLQSKGSGIFQIVNRRSGLCIAPDASVTPAIFKQVVCSGASVQQFSLTPWTPPPFVSPTCENINVPWAADTIRLNWASPITQGVRIQVRKAPTDSWSAHGAAAPVGSSSFQFSVGDFSNWNNGTAYYRITDLAGSELFRSTFRVQERWLSSSELKCS